MYNNLLNSVFASTKLSVISRLFGTAISLLLSPLTVLFRAFIDSSIGNSTAYTVIFSAVAIITFFFLKAVLISIIRKGFRKFIATKIS